MLFLVESAADCFVRCCCCGGSSLVGAWLVIISRRVCWEMCAATGTTGTVSMCVAAGACWCVALGAGGRCCERVWW
jgi:hypothetical protein